MKNKINKETPITATATRPRPSLLVSAALLAMACMASSVKADGAYQQVNLVSDLPGVAQHLDPQLVNPWGIAESGGSPFWISDNNAGVSTLYDGNGNPFPPPSPLVVMIPPPGGGTGSGTPTGVVFNGTPDFVVSEGSASAPAVFIFATEDGTLAGWNFGVDPANAVLAVDNSTSGGTAHLAVTFYFYPVANCTATTCQLDTGVSTSADGGATWTQNTQVAGPMTLSWLPNTTLDRMVGDYISTSFVGGPAFPAFAVASAPTSGGSDCQTATPNCNQPMFTVKGGLSVGGKTHPASDQASAGGNDTLTGSSLTAQ